MENGLSEGTLQMARMDAACKVALAIEHLVAETDQDPPTAYGKAVLKALLGLLDAATSHANHERDVYAAAQVAWLGGDVTPSEALQKEFERRSQNK